MSYYFSKNSYKMERLYDYRIGSIEIAGEEGEFYKLQVDNFPVFYWPKQFYNKTELRCIYNEVFLAKENNPHTYEYGPVKIKKDDWVIDAGTCEGFFTQKALGSGANVIMIEPLAVLVKALSYTFCDAMKAGKTRILPFLLGEEPSLKKIKYHPTQISSSKIDENEGDPVETRTIDSLIETEKIPRLDFIKMDIEGSEIKAILGAQETIKRNKPKLSIAVYHEYDTANILKDIILKIRPDYKIKFRGRYAWDNCPPRPYMLYAW